MYLLGTYYMPSTELTDFGWVKKKGGAGEMLPPLPYPGPPGPAFIVQMGRYAKHMTGPGNAKMNSTVPVSVKLLRIQET